MVTRKAKVFESGKYADKKCDITNNDLDLIVKNFTPAPVKVEHSDTAFDNGLGNLLNIERIENELFGDVELTDTAWELIKKTGAKKLSVGLDLKSKKIFEVSIVKNPRVKTARIFSDDASADMLYFSDCGEFSEVEEVAIVEEVVIEPEQITASVEIVKDLEESKKEFVDGLMEKIEESLPEFSYIAHVGVSNVVYGKDGKYFMCSYKIQDNKVTLGEENEEVALDWTKPTEVVNQINTGDTGFSVDNSDKSIEIPTPDDIKNKDDGDKLMDDNTNVVAMSEDLKDKQIALLSEQLKEKENELLKKDIEAKVAVFVAEGKITPAQVENASIIMFSLGDTVTNFNDKEVNTSELFAKFLEDLPTNTLFNDTLVVKTAEVTVDPVTFNLSKEQLNVASKMGISAEDYKASLDAKKDKEIK